MRELRRWSEEGATADEISVLEASQRERAPSNARARTLRALGVAAAMTTVVTTTTTGGTATTADRACSGGVATAAAATKGDLSMLSKILAVSLVSGGIVTGGLFASESSSQTLAPSGPVQESQ